MRHSDERQLLNDLLNGPELEQFREASLQRGLTAVRRERRQRKLIRSMAVAGVPLLALCWLAVATLMQRPTFDAAAVRPMVEAVVPTPVDRPSVEFISDEELLALFPNQSLALVGQAGNQRLLFLDGAVPN